MTTSTTLRQLNQIKWPSSALRLGDLLGSPIPMTLEKICFDFYYFVEPFIFAFTPHFFLFDFILWFCWSLYCCWARCEAQPWKTKRWERNDISKTFCDFYGIYIWFSLPKIPERNYDELSGAGVGSMFEDEDRSEEFHGQKKSVNHEKSKAERSFRPPFT